VDRRGEAEPQRRTYIGSFCRIFEALCLNPANVPQTIVSIVIDAHALMLAVMVLMVNGSMASILRLFEFHAVQKKTPLWTWNSETAFDVHQKM